MLKIEFATINSMIATLRYLDYFLSFFIIVARELKSMTLGERIKELRNKHGLS